MIRINSISLILLGTELTLITANMMNDNKNKASSQNCNLLLRSFPIQRKAIIIWHTKSQMIFEAKSPNKERLCTSFHYPLLLYNQSRKVSNIEELL